jgi:hypothetical protein
MLASVTAEDDQAGSANDDGSTPHVRQQHAQAEVPALPAPPRPLRVIVVAVLVVLAVLGGGVIALMAPGSGDTKAAAPTESPVGEQTLDGAEPPVVSPSSLLSSAEPATPSAGNAGAGSGGTGGAGVGGGGTGGGSTGGNPPPPRPPPRPPPAAPQNVCSIYWRINWWATQVCSHMSSNGSQVYGRLSLICYQGNFEPVDCLAIRIREVELFVNDVKLANWIGGTFYQGALTTGYATHPCHAANVYRLKGWEITIRGPDGVWSDTKTIGPSPNYRCLAS